MGMFTSPRVRDWVVLVVLIATAGTLGYASEPTIYGGLSDGSAIVGADNDEAQSQVESLNWKIKRRSVFPEDYTNNQDGGESCEVARMKCAYRTGCGMALQNYMIGCSEVISGSSKQCSDYCRNSLIALTSTEEGLALMKCKCRDSFCKDAKRRIDVCRTAVLQATHNSTTVSCSIAQWICMADPLCSTALDYYHRLCRSMFTGKKCTHRCNNSINILRKQEKAVKLSTCTCDGTEDFDCLGIHENMDRLCFNKKPSSTSHKSKTGGQTGAGVDQHDSRISENQSNNNARKTHHHPDSTDNQAQSASTSCPNSHTLVGLLLITVSMTYHSCP